MIHFKVLVDTKAALVAGKATIGEVSVEWGDEQVSALTEEQRLELATALKDILGSHDTDLPLKDSEFDTIQKGLQHRINIRNVREDQARHVAEACAVDAARTAEEEKVRRREEEEREAQRRLALQKWVEKNGDANQKARNKEGLLPEREILEALREHLFDELDTYEQLTRPVANDACTCACVAEVTLAITHPKGMTAEQYNRLADIREDIPKNAKVTPVLFEAKCQGGCDCKPVTVLGVAVQIIWNGFILTREYAL